jgi:hypothetical protein
MIFIETPVFPENMLVLMPDDSHAELQTFLAAQPDDGDVIQGTGGLRKVRWALPGKGKRGGARVIYYWRVLSRKSSCWLFMAKERRPT